MSLIGERFKRYVREVPDWPEPGVSFKDLNPLYADKRAFRHAQHIIAGEIFDYSPDYIVAIEARGFILGAPIARLLDCAFVPVRKAGKLPGPTSAVDYELEYGSATLELPSFHIQPDSKVVIFDDVLATGGTVAATHELVRLQGASVLATAFLAELTYLNGRDRINIPVHSLIQFPS